MLKLIDKITYRQMAIIWIMLLTYNLIVGDISRIQYGLPTALLIIEYWFKDNKTNKK